MVPKRSRSPRSGGFRPRLEGLEERLVLQGGHLRAHVADAPIRVAQQQATSGGGNALVQQLQDLQALFNQSASQEVRNSNQEIIDLRRFARHLSPAERAALSGVILQREAQLKQNAQVSVSQFRDLVGGQETSIINFIGSYRLGLGVPLIPNIPGEGGLNNTQPGGGGNTVPPNGGGGGGGQTSAAFCSNPDNVNRLVRALVPVADAKQGNLITCGDWMRNPVPIALLPGQG